ncbi:hypothetical protein [Micromonospora sp. KC213]|uniref:hypothetical protein n=1 Tax=Micromonospora sp. KC213 TaxID=2530378 RepID=UPI00104A47CE|nr:hypothetical protein [Micromonospora sp. KC213]TDC38418.1 hypothetical protein E1166_18620 [Micromonospora sp. KC213]
MPPDAPHRTPPRRLALAGALLAALPLTACATPPSRGAAAPSASPDLRTPATAGAPAVPPANGLPTAAAPGGSPATALPGYPQGVPTGTTGPGLLPTPGAPAGSTPAPAAAPCRGRPPADRVIRLLRGHVLPRDVAVRATKGPLCADGWQYTVLAVTGYEELQAVTRGEPTALRLVTAGTDVCSIEVRATAPPAIRTLACDDALPGA